MPTISATVIKKPRKSRRCDHHLHGEMKRGKPPLIMEKGKPQLRLFGNASCYDKPYTLYICLHCAARIPDPKIIEALKRYPE